MTTRILVGDCIELLRKMPAESVHCVVTSPPYWGLRDYGISGQLGMEPSLGEHIAAMGEVFREIRRVLRADGTCWVNYGDCYATSPNGRSAADTKAAGKDDRTFRDEPFSTIGPIEGAQARWKIGANVPSGAILSPNHEKARGSFKSGDRQSRVSQSQRIVATGPRFEIDDSSRQKSRRDRSGNLGNGGVNGAGLPNGRVVAGGYLKPKDLCMIPNRLAIALQDDGWWVRSEIIWHKTNPMPESVIDRPAGCHEKVWLLTKSERYFYDGDAVLQPVTGTTHARVSQNVAAQIGSSRANGGGQDQRPHEGRRAR